MRLFLTLSTVLLFAALWTSNAAETKIDRHALVTRHNVELTNAANGSWLQVGNGEIAFGIDLTGLQTYAGNTMSHWGWHTAPLPVGIKPEDFKMEQWDAHGRKVGYATNARGQERLWNWLRESPHCMNLGRFRLLLDGKPVSERQLTKVIQRLDLWSGVIISRYNLDGQAVTVETCAHPTRDMVAVRIDSPMVTAKRLSVEFAFPYGSSGVSGADWSKPQAHTTVLRLGSDHSAVFERQLDNDRYQANLTWGESGQLREVKPHTFLLEPDKKNGVLEFTLNFSATPDKQSVPGFKEVKLASGQHWPEFWNSGGAIDLSASKDSRWKELERRIVLSQYLMAVNAAGSLPPQEAGLYNNGWNGKFHLEMHWWHGVHDALWNRWGMFDRSLGWYQKILPVARAIAQCQGYKGARWPKMVGPDGLDAPSPIGPLLIWQQPHPIYYATLDYRLHPTRATLEKWREIVFATAEFMSSYAVYDEAAKCYVLGSPLKTVPENTDPRTTRNPAFELSYWRYGLRVAQQWRENLGLERESQWDKVLNSLAPLPQHDGVYLQQEGMTDTFSRWNWEHPSLVGPLGMLPGDGVDPVVMKATVRKVSQAWQWERTWGWDFPLQAMAAARNGEPKLAVKALLEPAGRNNFNAVGLSNGGPFPYFPSNGGLLTAVAMMAAGWDGCPERNAPGFPDDGSWVVKWEGLKRLP